MADERFPTDRAVLEKEVVVRFVVAGGPGGQHRNRAQTGVRIHHPPSGVTVTATERRSQHQNLELAWERLVARLRLRNRRPKPRRPTRKPRSADRRRLEQKRRRSERKRDRRRPEDSA